MRQENANVLQRNKNIKKEYGYLNHCVLNKMSEDERILSRGYLWGKKRISLEEFICPRNLFSPSFPVSLFPYEVTEDVPLWGRGGGLTEILCKALTCIVLIKSENCILKRGPFEGTLF